MARLYVVEGYWMDRDLDTAYPVLLHCNYYRALSATPDSPAEPEEVAVTRIIRMDNKVEVPLPESDMELEAMEAHCLDSIHSGNAISYADRH